MANYVYPAIGLIGGTAGFLDAIDGTNLADKDMAMVAVQGDKIYFYVLDVDSAAAEASPGIIAPDSNGGDKRWLLVGFTPEPETTGFTIAGGTTPKTLTVTGDAEIGQAWTTPAFNAGDFTASESMTWTVEEGDVLSFAYNILGKVMICAFRLATTTVGGTLSDALLIKIPAGKTATKIMENHLSRLVDNNVKTEGFCYTNGTNICIARSDQANFAASTNLTTVIGQITFEIN